MSVHAINWAFAQDLPTSAKFVLVALADYSNEYGQCWPGQASLAEKCGLTERTVRTQIHALEEAGLIAIQYRTDRTRKRIASKYILRIKTTAKPPEIDAQKRSSHRKLTHKPPEILSGPYIEEPSLKATVTVGDSNESPDTSSKTPPGPASQGVVFDSQENQFRNIPVEVMEAWYHAFQSIDVDAEIERAEQWYVANPRRRKKNHPRFLVNWLHRAQERADQRKVMMGTKAVAGPVGAAYKPFPQEVR